MAKEDYAGIGSRAIAVITDHIILMIITMVITLPFGMTSALFSIMGSVANPVTLASVMALMSTLVVISLVIWILYFTYFESTTGQTLGKKMVNIKVVREDGKKLTFAEAFLRTILRMIDGLAVYLLGFIVVLVSEKKQRIGDIAAKTVVVRA
jgi:uncharacterized RDD family membrane protein YckC